MAEAMASVLPAPLQHTTAILLIEYLPFILVSERMDLCG